jgi:hypothetical protein
MRLSEFRQADGGYLYKDCYYQDATDLLQTGFFEFCSCGAPEDNLEYVLRGLESIAALQDKVWTKAMTYEQWAAECDKHLGDDKAQYFFFYWADFQELTEHGGAVPGWLTDKGRDVMTMLREWWHCVPCEECDGSGESSVQYSDGTFSSTAEPPCAVCGGTGLKHSAANPQGEPK